MIRTLDPSMLNIPYSARVLAPLAAKHGIKAVSLTADLLDDPEGAADTAAFLRDNGMGWGLLPMPADFYHWALSDDAFENGLRELGRRAAIAEKLGVKTAYNHVWPSSTREFDENYEWHVKRVAAVTRILSDHGVHYGLEFLGPHELRTLEKHEFVHTITDVLAIADAAGGKTGIAFDVYHWYTSSEGSEDDLAFMEKNIERLVCVHMSDGVEGLTYDKQQDLVRRLPMETGIIDSRMILSRFIAAGADVPYIIEPFEPARTRFHALSAEDAVALAAEVFGRVDGQK